MAIERAFPWTHRALVRILLTFLHGHDALHLAHAHRVCLEAVLPVLQHYQRSSAQLALAIWCMRSLRLAFEAHYQELETQHIPRSQTHDPRVPPRVVPIWSERGAVEGGALTLHPSTLPFVHRDGITVQFAVSRSNVNSNSPMLMNVVQSNRRIYTIVTLQLVRSLNTSPLALRRFTYIKEFSEWLVPSPALKQNIDNNCNSPCRFDLLSLDGSVALELAVPARAEALVDYYSVTQAVVTLHLREVLQRLVALARLPAWLPEPTATAGVDCVIIVAFRTLRGALRQTLRVKGRLTVERPAPQHETAGGGGIGRTSGIEHFDIVTCSAVLGFESESVESEILPTQPGYLWLRVDTTATAARQRQTYFHAVALHYGATQTADTTALTLDARWLPGILKSSPTRDSRNRRCLKGYVTITRAIATGALQKLTVVAQHLDTTRLARYAATVHSYTRIEPTQAAAPEH